ncbi:MAG: hypothetical protein Kow0059_15660 [Candidatus Sumerlaeia bacterium]
MPAVVLIVCVALTLAAPWGRYAAPFALLGLALGVRWAQGDGRERRFVLGVVAAGLVLRLLFALMIHSLEHPPSGPFYFFDDVSYHTWGARIAADWRAGLRPRLSGEGLIGSLHTGYYRVVGVVYYLSGRAWPGLAIALNALFGALASAVVFYLTGPILSHRLGKPRKPESSPPAPGADASTTSFACKSAESTAPAAAVCGTAHQAALIAAVHPGLLYWSAFVLKDTLHALLFLAAVWLYLEARQARERGERWLLWAPALAGVLGWLAIVRAYSPVVLATTAFVFELVWGRRRVRLVAGAAAVCAGLAIAAAASRPIFEILDQLLFSFLNLVPDAVGSVGRVYVRMAASLPRFFLSPYGWVVWERGTLRPVWDVSYYSYPGQWVNYVLIYPLALAGVGRAFREDLRGVFFILLPLFLQFYLYMITFGGAAPRQMLPFVPLFGVMAALGEARRPALSVFLLYYALLGAFIAAHLSSLLVG